MTARTRFALGLWSLLFLFCLRVLGQVLVAFFHARFLPPMKAWMSGLLPYPYLLASQILIIALFTKICIDLTSGTGYFATVRPAWSLPLCYFGWIYFAGMIVRYVVRMYLRPDQRWLGGCIPIFFHFVLASYILTLGRFHQQSARSSSSYLFSTYTRPNASKS